MAVGAALNKELGRANTLSARSLARLLKLASGKMTDWGNQRGRLMKEWHAGAGGRRSHGWRVGRFDFLLRISNIISIHNKNRD